MPTAFFEVGRLKITPNPQAISCGGIGRGFPQVFGYCWSVFAWSCLLNRPTLNVFKIHMSHGEESGSPQPPKPEYHGVELSGEKRGSPFAKATRSEGKWGRMGNWRQWSKLERLEKDAKKRKDPEKDRLRSDPVLHIGLKGSLSPRTTFPCLS